MNRYKNKEWLQKMWNEERLEIQEIANRCNVTEGTIRYWRDKFGIQRPWNVEENLRSMYDSGMSIAEMSEEFEVDYRTVWQNMEKYEIERREKWEHRVNSPAYFQTDTQGYERWETGGDCFYVHQLLAISEFGVETVKECDDIHHISKIPWDNRPSNLKPVTRSEHRKIHS